MWMRGLLGGVLVGLGIELKGWIERGGGMGQRVGRVCVYDMCLLV
jgi:hypothetical protein